MQGIYPLGLFAVCRLFRSSTKIAYNLDLRELKNISDEKWENTCISVCFGGPIQ